MKNNQSDSLKEALAEIEFALNGPGLPWDSPCRMDDVSRYFAIAKMHSEKPWCVVQDWQIWNLKGVESEREWLGDNGYISSVIYAKNVIQHQYGMAVPGYQIRSTLLKGEVVPGLYESCNTMYVLVGNGLKKEVSIRAVNNIVFDSF